MRQVEDENAEYDADERSYPMHTAKDDVIKGVQAVPQASPNEHKSERDPHVAAKVFNRMFLKFL